MPREPERCHGHKLGIMASVDILFPRRWIVVLSLYHIFTKAIDWS